MNWKINYWTIITLFLAGSLVYSCMDNEMPANKAKWKQQINTIDKNVEKVLEVVTATEGCPSAPDTISGKDAAGRILAAMTKLREIENAVEIVNEIIKLEKSGSSYDSVKLPNDTISIPTNFSFTQFQLPECEVQKMFERIPTGNAIIYLTVEPHPDSSGRQMLSTIIGDTDISLNNGKLIASDQDSTFFFDYINPCPPMCKD